jgi:hypothetical protein
MCPRGTSTMVRCTSTSYLGLRQSEPACPCRWPFCFRFLFYFHITVTLDFKAPCVKGIKCNTISLLTDLLSLVVGITRKHLLLFQFTWIGELSIFRLTASQLSSPLSDTRFLYFKALHLSSFFHIM